MKTGGREIRAGVGAHIAALTLLAAVGLAATVSAPAGASSGCRVPRVLGDGPWWAKEQLERAGCDVRLVAPDTSHLGNQVVLAQSRPSGSHVAEGTLIRLRMGSRPPAPRGCRAPRLARVLRDSSRLIAWVDQVRESDRGKSFGEGPETYVACVPPAGPTHVFFAEENDLTYYASIRSLRTAGPYIATTSCSENHYGDGSCRVDLFNGKLGRRVFSAVYRFFHESNFPDVTPEAIAVNARGDLAWVRRTFLSTEAQGSTPQETIAVWDGQRKRDVESASSITGLVLSGGQLRWLSSGAPRSATIE